MVIAPFNIRARLESLLEDDLGFKDRDGTHRLHSLHAYAAKFPGELPRHFIAGLSAEGETVLDPMCGSGATLVEGWLLGRKVIGVDLDPLAVRQSRAKTTWIEPTELVEVGNRVVKEATKLREDGCALDVVLGPLDPESRKFIDYWFLPRTQQELAALILAIRGTDAHVRPYLEMLLSATIVTKSGGVSLARDLAHSRPHKVEKEPRDAVERFAAMVRQATRALEGVRYSRRGTATVFQTDTRRLPLPDRSVDLIVTSPPYANALDYIRAHKFSLVWLGESIPSMSALRGEYVGAERLARELAGLPGSVELAVNEIARVDVRKAKVLRKYFADMNTVFGQIMRVLRPGRAAVIVIGPSTIRGIPLETHEHLAALACASGLDVVGVKKRQLDRDRRMLPLRLVREGSGIELRIHEEYIIGLSRSKLCQPRPCHSWPT